MATRRGCSGQKQGPRSGYQNMSLFRRICQSRHGPAPSQKEWFQRVTQREICSCRRNNFSMLKIPQYRNIFKLKSTTRTHTHTHAHTRTHTHTHAHTHAHTQEVCFSTPHPHSALGTQILCRLPPPGSHQVCPQSTLWIQTWRCAVYGLEANNCTRPNARERR